MMPLLACGHSFNKGMEKNITLLLIIFAGTSSLALANDQQAWNQNTLQQNWNKQNQQQHQERQSQNPRENQKQQEKWRRQQESQFKKQQQSQKDKKQNVGSGI